MDPDLSVFAIRTMDQVVSRSMGTRRFALLTIGGFGIVSLGLALMGVSPSWPSPLNSARRKSEFALPWAPAADGSWE